MRNKVRRRRAASFRTQERILNAALTLFARKGYHAATVAEIAERARLAPSSLYNHFSGKEEIFRMVVEREASRLAGLIRDLDGRPGAAGAAEGLARLGDRLLGAFRRSKAFLVVALGEAIRSGGRGAVFNELFIRRLEADLAGFLAELPGVGGGSPPRLRTVARLFLGALLWLFIAGDLLDTGGTAQGPGHGTGATRELAELVLAGLAGGEPGGGDREP